MMEFGASLSCLSLKEKSYPFTRRSPGSPTYARGHSGNVLKNGAHPRFQPSSLHKRVGQKGAEVERKIREMSEMLPTFEQS